MPYFPRGCITYIIYCDNLNKLLSINHRIQRSNITINNHGNRFIMYKPGEIIKYKFYSNQILPYRINLQNNEEDTEKKIQSNKHKYYRIKKKIKKKILCVYI